MDASAWAVVGGIAGVVLRELVSGAYSLWGGRANNAAKLRKDTFDEYRQLYETMRKEVDCLDEQVQDLTKSNNRLERKYDRAIWHIEYLEREMRRAGQTFTAWSETHEPSIPPPLPGVTNVPR